MSRYDISTCFYILDSYFRADLFFSLLVILHPVLVFDLCVYSVTIR
jgi:hypothetical protein